MQILEKLDVYRLSRELAVETYQMARVRPLSAHPFLADQIARAAVSIPANIAEAYALGTRPSLCGEHESRSGLQPNSTRIGGSHAVSMHFPSDRSPMKRPRAWNESPACWSGS